MMRLFGLRCAWSCLSWKAVRRAALPGSTLPPPGFTMAPFNFRGRGFRPPAPSVVPAPSAALVVLPPCSRSSAGPTVIFPSRNKSTEQGLGLGLRHPLHPNLLPLSTGLEAHGQTSRSRRKVQEAVPRYPYLVPVRMAVCRGVLTLPVRPGFVRRSNRYRTGTR